MPFIINYQKRKNHLLFQKFQTNKQLLLSNVQNYIPIYDLFFSLNNTNWNAIQLNHPWAITDIEDNVKDNIYYSTIKHISDDTFIQNHHKTFIKIIPLLEPCKYVVGKYDHTDETLFQLPNYNNNKVHDKISNKNNSAYIDSFFVFLTCELLHEHSFLHGLDYYGSFLAIQNKYTVNVRDDIDYLVENEFFLKQNNKLYTIDDYSHLFVSYEPNKIIKKPIKITNSPKSLSSVKSIHNDLFEDLFCNDDSINDTNDNDTNDNDTNDNDTNDNELIDITYELPYESKSNSSKSNSSKSNSSKSNSSTSDSSRSSHTNDDDIDEFSDIYEDISDDDDDFSDIDDTYDPIMMTIPKFPVQVTCMEQCENTFNSLLNNISDDEVFSALMQVIMILITYQKLFAFTHNDLHTENIMYVTTNKKFLYYKYKNQTYKVPTFGRIFKLIDFGRAIYKYNGKLFCSDAFQIGGDAATQYNTDPYLNENKPRLDPNYSFDLCRLACCMIDTMVDDFEIIRNEKECSPLIRLIVSWLKDDNGINMLYKNNGMERYENFKLYKMIARLVHNHTPQKQLERPEFSKYMVNGKNIPKDGITSIINIDNLPVYI